MTYNVTLPIFKGPFDLLLHLIKINEMDIYDIPIADITQKYLEYIQQLQELDLDVAGEFLVIASHLLSMKARSLIPSAEDEAEPEDLDEGADPIFRQSPREFMRQLIAYRKYKDLARQLSQRHAESARIVYRNVPPPAPPVAEADLEDAAAAGAPGLDGLLEAFSRVLRYLDQNEAVHRVTLEHVTVEEKLLYLDGRLREQPRLDVTEEFGRCLHKVEMVVTLLAILELARLRRIRIVQEAMFGQIAIEATDDPGDGEHHEAATGSTVS